MCVWRDPWGFEPHPGGTAPVESSAFTPGAELTRNSCSAGGGRINFSAFVKPGGALPDNSAKYVLYVLT